MTNPGTHARDYTPTFNRVLYILMVLLSLYYLILSKDVSNALNTLAIGLIFDPFKSEVSWDKRPWYQKAVLLSHVTAVFVLLIINFFS